MLRPGRLRVAITAAALSVLSGQSVAADGYTWRLPSWLAPPPVPSDNAMSAPKVALGRRLFYDLRLSGPGYMSCASCHNPRLGFTDGRRVAIGVTGEWHSLNTPQLANVAYQSALTWADPSIQSLEAQVLKVLFGEHPLEMAVSGREQQVLDHLRFNQDYAVLFRAAFPERPLAIDFDVIAKAIAAFQRTLVSAGSPYDRFRYAGEPAALSPAARRGEALFNGPRLRCGECHSGPHLTDAIPQASYHNTGLYNVDGRGGLPRGSRGLFDRTGDPLDMGRFKTPSLRNVALTAPYMHDGSLASLEVVIDHYSAGGEAARRGQRSPLASERVPGFRISGDERRDLIAFLESLTDAEFLAREDIQTPYR